MKLSLQLRDAVLNLWGARAQTSIAFMVLSLGLAALLTLQSLNEGLHIKSQQVLMSSQKMPVGFHLWPDKKAKLLNHHRIENFLHETHIEGFAYTLIPLPVLHRGKQIPAQVVALSEADFLSQQWHLALNTTLAGSRVCWVGSALQIPKGSLLQLGDTSCQVTQVVDQAPHPFLAFDPGSSVGVSAVQLKRFDHKESLMSFFLYAEEDLAAFKARVLSALNEQAGTVLKGQWQTAQAWQAMLKEQQTLWRQALEGAAWVGILLGALILIQMTLLTLEQRKKEIGLRQMLGAGTSDIFYLLGGELILLTTGVALSSAILGGLLGMIITQSLDLPYLFPFKSWFTSLFGVCCFCCSLYFAALCRYIKKPPADLLRL